MWGVVGWGVEGAVVGRGEVFFFKFNLFNFVTNISPFSHFSFSSSVGNQEELNQKGSTN